MIMRLGASSDAQPANISLINRRVSASPRDPTAVGKGREITLGLGPRETRNGDLTGSFISAQVQQLEPLNG